MAKASINFKPIKEQSEQHNYRTQNLDYVEKEFSSMNENWQSHSVAEMEREIKRYCKEKSGRKLQKNSTPIREAVVNINQYHLMDDLKKLADRLEKEKGMKCFQIHIHRDEGRWENDQFIFNYHAHMLFRWQDMETGKTLRLNKADMSQIQTLVAEEMKMERGELKENSNRERLEAVEYKVKERKKELELIEQKKNTVRERIKALRGDREGFSDKEGGEDRESASNRRKETLWAIFSDIQQEFNIDDTKWSEFAPEDVAWAIERAKSEISGFKNA